MLSLYLIGVVLVYQLNYSTFYQLHTSLFLSKKDYALFRNILWNNIGEQSRHLEEWNAMLTLSDHELLLMKEKIMVHFGYDKKDGPPSTYSLIIEIPEVTTHFSTTGVNAHVSNVADIFCSEVKWSLRKVEDQISRQQLTCAKITLTQTSNKVDWERFKCLLQPAPESDDTTSKSKIDSMVSPQFIFKSTSRPNGDNVKSLEIRDACIYFIYSAWMYVKDFFQDLPNPDFMSKEEILSCVQIGDRWYKMSNEYTKQKIDKSDRGFQSEQDSKGSVDRTNLSQANDKNALAEYRPSFQFRLLLISPRIILVSNSSSKNKDPCKTVTLHLSHLDLLYKNEPSKENGMYKVDRTFSNLFIHDMELFTGYITSELKERRKNALIYPICIGAITINETPAITSSDTLKKDTRKIFIASDVVCARAAYSDIALGIDVILNCLTDAKTATSTKENLQSNHLATQQDFVEGPIPENTTDFLGGTPHLLSCLNVYCCGFDILIVDDSGRHFAEAQNLVNISLSEIKLNRSYGNGLEHILRTKPYTSLIDNSTLLITNLTRLQLNHFELTDELQMMTSPFRTAGSDRNVPSSHDLFALNPTQWSSSIGKDNNEVSQADLSKKGRSKAEFEDVYGKSTTYFGKIMNWEQYSMVEVSWGYSLSPSLFEKTVSPCLPIGNFPNIDTERKHLGDKLGVSHQTADCSISSCKDTNFLELRYICHGNLSHLADIKFQNYTLQWNPSTVIVLQRFMGRLKKHMISDDSFFSNSSAHGTSNNETTSIEKNNHVNVLPGNQSDGTNLQNTISIHIILRLDNLCICLNKEHQRRRLMELSLSKCHFEFERECTGQLHVHGYISDFIAQDPSSDIDQCNKPILTVTCKEYSSRVNKSDRPKKNRPEFISFEYRTFVPTSQDLDKKSLDTTLWNSDNVPEWICDMICDHNHSILIDDCLSVSVAPVRFTYIRERTEEIIDYLSNGLPGKGMGATSRVATGFIKKRIKTHSYFSLAIDPPEVFAPANPLSTEGIIFRLGDVRLKSWFEEATHSDAEAIQCDNLYSRKQKNIYSGSKSKSSEESDILDWWRVLSISIIGMSWHTHNFALSRPEQAVAPKEKPVDIHFILYKSLWFRNSLIARGKMSSVNFILKYSEYELLRTVLRNNVTKPVNMDRWDNVEKEYSLESNNETEKPVSADAPAGLDQSSINAQNDVAYSSHARFIRYGMKGKRIQAHNLTQKSHIPSYLAPSQTNIEVDDSKDSQNSTNNGDSCIDVRFELGGLSMILHRDDFTDHFAKSQSEARETMNYDIVRFHVDQVDITVSTNVYAGKSICVNLYRLGLYDLGDVGRMSREQYHSSLSESKENSNTMNENKQVLNTRKSCAFSVIAEGYVPLQEDQSTLGNFSGTSLQSDADPQVSIGVDTAVKNLKDDSDSMVARLTVNCLNLNPLQKPLIELAEFFTCSWSKPLPTDIPTHTRNQHEKNHYECSVKKESKMEKSKVEISEKGPKKLVIKLVAQYPQIFLLADDSDIFTKALVLRGIAVVNSSVTSKSLPIKTHQNSYADEVENNIEKITSIDAHFHGMESYINSNVFNVLESGYFASQKQYKERDNFYPPGSKSTNHTLGVALIQPVTSSFEYCEIRKPNFPSTRTLFVTFDPISTMISFEDLDLIENIMIGWSSRKFSKKYETSRMEEDQVEHESKHSSEISRNVPKRTIENENQSIDNTNYAPVDQLGTQIYEIVFYEKKLGLALRSSGGSVVVDNVGIEKYIGKINLGDELVSISGQNVNRMSFQSIIDVLASSNRPLSLCFKRKNVNTSERTFGKTEFSCNDDSASDVSTEPASSKKVGNLPETGHRNTTDAYKITFKTCRKSGLIFKESCCNGLPVVTEINEVLFNEAAICSSNIFCNVLNPGDHKLRAPSPGAVVVAVDEILMNDLDFVSFMTKLNDFEKSFEMSNLIEDEVGSDPPVPVSDDTISKEYSLTFLTISSRDWGTVDNFNINISEIKLTIIDDINGRDMPLLRGSMNSLSFHLDRGLGLATKSIDVSPPYILHHCYNAMKLLGNKTSNNLDNSSYGINPDMYTAPVSDDSLKNGSEAINIISLSSRISLDYYNSKLAIWEPFLESCHLQIDTELQKGDLNQTPPRPGHISFIISDKRHGNSVKIDGIDNNSDKLIGLNISDTAAELFLTTSQEWILWRTTRLNDRMNHSTNFVERPLCVDDHSKVSKNKIEAFPTIITNDKSESNSKRSIATAAARGALNFAKKRGAQNQQTGDAAKPFVLRNRTGMNIGFIQQNPTLSSNSVQNYSVEEIEVDENAHFGKFRQSNISQRITDGEEARFNIDPIQHSNIDSTLSPYSDPNDSTFILSDQSRHFKKVRAYDSKFPMLCIEFQSSDDLLIEPIKNLPIVKVGKSLRRLKVKKILDSESHLDGQAMIDDDNYATSILVMCEVALERNRRIITVSSAIRIESSSCKIPIEIGVMQYSKTSISTNTAVLDQDCHGSDGIEITPAFGDDDIKIIGVSTPTDPLYIPLWIDLQFRDAQIFLRPLTKHHEASNTHSKNKKYHWSLYGILHYSHSDNKDMGGENLLSKDKCDTKKLANQATNWFWSVFDSKQTLCCYPEESFTHDSTPAWLLQSLSIGDFVTLNSDAIRSNLPKSQTITVSIRPLFTLRNVLPVGIEWEIRVSQMQREKQSEQNLNFSSFRDISDQSILHPGQGLDILNCNLSSSSIIQFRVRLVKCAAWSEYANIHLSNYSSSENRQTKVKGESIGNHEGTNKMVNNLFLKF